MPFRHILVPSAFDVTSEQALEHALSLATSLHARMTLLHVYGLPAYSYPDGPLLPSPNLVESVKKAASDELDAFIAKHKDKLGAVAAVVREGQTAHEICKAAIELEADLIVMGTHGHGLLGRTLLGSVAAAVLRASVVPVMTVRMSAPHEIV